MGKWLAICCLAFMAALLATLSLSVDSARQLVVSAPAPNMHIVIDTDKRTLTVFIGDEPQRTLPCAVGKTLTQTPIGEWTIVDKSANWGGGFGTRWLGFNVPWGIYGIHGTNKPSTIGTAASAGCVRMLNRDVEWLYSVVKIGTRATVVGTRQKMSVQRPLRRGQTGKEVLQLQFSLRAAGFSPGLADGRFGAQTEQAIRDMQAFYGVAPTGRADKNILTLLGLNP